MKKLCKATCLTLVFVIAFMISGCNVSTSKSYSFDVETGDRIKVTLDTSGDLSLSQKDGHFIVTEEDEKILEGIFIHEEGYKAYVDIKGEQGMTVLEDTQKDGNRYYMYEFDGTVGTEDNFVMWIDDSNTGLIMASLAGRDKAKEAFERLTIENE